MFDSLDTVALAKIRGDIAPTNMHADEYAMSAVTLVRTLVDEELAKREPIEPIAAPPPEPTPHESKGKK
jgi:hypothetical protein